MTLFSIESPTWGDQYPASIQDATVDALEGGSIIVFPNLAFRLEPDELKFLNPGAVHGAKNVSFNPATGKVGGTKVEGPAREQLQALLNRFSRTTAALVRALLTPYASGLQQGRASLRPVEIAGRASSWRADDTRLHVDAFPSQPVRDKRILRVFTNINPAGQPRTWKVGGSFDDVARCVSTAAGTDLEALLRSLTHGRPYGSDAWTARAERRLGLGPLRPRGRPKGWRKAKAKAK